LTLFSHALVGQSKNNLGRMNLPTLAFHIAAACVARTAEGEVWTGKLEWLGETRRAIKTRSWQRQATARRRRLRATTCGRATPGANRDRVFMRE
jgi:hypothetical protein